MNKLMDIIQEDAAKICEQIDFSSLYGQSILITGASGLLGVSMVACLKHLLENDSAPMKVYAVTQSNLLPYQSHFFTHPNITLFQGNLTDFQFCKSLPVADNIIHAAGYAQPARFMENPIETMRLNTSTTFSLFEKLLPQGKFLFISTAEVYSGLTSLLHRESEIGTTTTTHPRACYIEAKRCAEAICNSYRAAGIDAKSARLALAYGPGTKPGDKRALNAFIEKGLNGQITMLDHGLAKRTYCYVADAVEILWDILLFGQEPIYNVGGDSRTTIAELAQQIGDTLNVPVVFPASSTESQGAPDDVQLDMSLVRNAFGKTTFMPFETGLARTIEWQQALYESLVPIG